MKYLVKLRRVVTQEVEMEIDSENFPHVNNCLDAMTVAEDAIANLDPDQVVSISQVHDGGWKSSSVKQ